MQELLLVNPKSRKRRASAKRRKAPSAKQLAARRKFAAMAKARANTARASNPKRRRKASRRKSSHRSNPVQVNIMRRARKANPSRRRRHARRRNPSAISFKAAFSRPMSILKPALVGAVGAIAVNKGLSMIPLPPMLMAGRARYLTQAAAAIGLAVIAQKVGVKGQTAADMARGSLTVTLADAIRDVAGQAGLNLNGMGYYLPGLGVQAVPSAGANAAMTVNGMGKYLTGPGANVMNMAGVRGVRGMSFNR